MAKGLKRWQVFPSHTELAQKLGSHLQVSPLVAQLLLNRNIRSLKDAQRFLSPVCMFTDHFEPDRLEKAEALIESMIHSGQKILVYGDYDVDGITSTTMMVSCLRALGAQVDFFIPNRFRDGYGLSMGTLSQIQDQHYGLLITLDCGISNHAEITQLKAHSNTQVLVFDHHKLPDLLPPAEVIINPKTLPTSHPFYSLCTAGIVYVFLDHYVKTFGKAFPIESLLDLAALGTIADVVPLVGTNRDMVCTGLEVLSGRDRLGIRALLQVSEFTKPKITPRDVSFVIAPRMNAAGRLADASTCVSLLLSTDYAEALELAQYLQRLNEKRQAIGAQILTDSKGMLAEKNERHRSIVLAAYQWHSGVIGITASQLVNLYSVPAVVISMEGKIGRGSARTVGNIDIYSLLRECSSHFITFGGHKQAAGFSISPEQVPAFQEAFTQVCKEKIEDQDLVSILDLDMALDPADISMDLAESIQKIGPFGEGNPSPLFYSQSLRAIDFRKVGEGGAHLKAVFTDVSGQKVFDAIGFGLGHQLELLHQDSVQLAFHLDINEWNGKTSTQLQLVDIK